MADNLQSIEKLMSSYDSNRSRLAETQKLVSSGSPLDYLKVLKIQLEFMEWQFF